MKKNILSILTLFSILMGSFTLNAQDLILSDEVVHHNFENVDFATQLDLFEYFAVTNNTNEVMELKWERIVLNSTESEWKSQVCDNNTCYGFNTSTNYDPDNLIDEPFILEAGETFSEFALHVWPQGTPGCGQYLLRFSRTSAPDDILAVIQVNASVNTPDCTFLSSTDEKEAVADVILYPNPSFGQFTLSNNDVVKQLAVYNILGKQVRQINYVNGDYVDVSDLANGMYLVALQNDEGQTLKTLRISKRNFQP